LHLRQSDSVFNAQWKDYGTISVLSLCSTDGQMGARGTAKVGVSGHMVIISNDTLF